MNLDLNSIVKEYALFKDKLNKIENAKSMEDVMKLASNIFTDFGSILLNDLNDVFTKKVKMELTKKESDIEASNKAKVVK